MHLAKKEVSEESGKERKDGSPGAPGEQTQGSEMSVPHSLPIPGTELAACRAASASGARPPARFPTGCYRPAQLRPSAWGRKWRGTRVKAWRS